MLLNALFEISSVTAKCVFITMAFDALRSPECMWLLTFFVVIIVTVEASKSRSCATG